ncbi:hypothetical protein TRVA0_009S03092 [Trichomonascus vanleenenianus]|uniref:uncharacterized protein n=1 Tax=Trichomonascus vanleenenianus TaxID=2268995 RepID=UPI003EC9FCE3
MRDSERSHIHMTLPRTAVYFEEWMKSKLEFDDIIVPPEHQPVNPEEEDDMITEQQGMMGIARSHQKAAEPAWRDLALNDLLNNAPSTHIIDQTKLPDPRFDTLPVTDPDPSTSTATATISTATTTATAASTSVDTPIGSPSRRVPRRNRSQTANNVRFTR